MSNELPAVTKCWLVWQKADDGGRPYLVAVDTSEELARLHVQAVMDDARIHDRVTVCHIEESWINHRYGESMGQGFDALRAMLRDNPLRCEPR